MFAARGFLRPGVSVIHGVALKPADFHDMAAREVGLLWSPRSNLELYGETTDVVSALREKVTIALSPDWSPTGSDGMLQELKFATTWNSGQAHSVFTDAQLVLMATKYPARLAGLADKIGTLAVGYYADLMVVKSTGQDVYSSIVHANPADISLVVVGGEPVYGDLELMKSLLLHQQTEMLTLCGVRKAIYFGSESKLQEATPNVWSRTTEELTSALRKWGTSLAPLADCGN
jgi:cytosine/adenosine deaminase-related metal-dependent hydrolase